MERQDDISSGCESKIKKDLETIGKKSATVASDVVADDFTDINAPKDFTSPEVLYKQLITTIRNYHPSTDISMIEKAYTIAFNAHKDQVRKSGEPYIIHPICVGIILAELELDKETIVAGLLHDVVEDTVLTTEEITKEFNAEVALLVDGVTKLTQLNYSKDKVEIQAENLRKMFLAMAKDIRVILIKLADRLHNMRTLQYMKPEKQREKARETMDIYAPIAQRLGISKIKIELDDLSLKYLEPEVYKELTEKITSKKTEREDFIQGIVREVRNHVESSGIDAKIDGRVKHFFSIYKKMINQNKTLDQIYDLFAVRIIVDTVKDCYAALGVIHEMYKPIPGRFKDYIAMPKANMYQSLHTTLIGPLGQPFEIQIRTFDMHRTAEFGIAAHWKYKESQDGKNTRDNEEAKLTWLRQILEWQRDMSDNKEFLSLLKSDLDLFSESVYCFTPSGDVKNLPNGSTPIDFAYSIHSAVGNKMVGSRVNGKLVTIDYVIQNGDRIEIITSQNSRGPSRDWLSIVKSTQAKNKINQWFKTELKEDNIIKGKEMIDKYCKVKSIVISDIMKPEFMQKVMQKYGFRDWDSIYAAVGHGGLKEGQVVNKLQEEYTKKHRKEITDEKLLETISEVKENKAATVAKTKGGIVVEGIHDVAVRFSKCCSPVPGDEIIGFVTRGRGVSIHRTDCINVINLPEEDRIRLIEAEWHIPEDKIQGELYTTEIRIFANNRNGVLLDVSKIFTESKIDVTSMTVRTSKQGTATISVGFEINGVEQLKTIIAKIRNVESVLDIERTTG
ncbi:RelA/SpoT family protein [Anaeromicropila herbilytica]|uniref:GTP diphosphokinase n=1 Tax=Anaeromicropila herbilytica TaxID=2785025 RepID=A0A7R7EJL7_9FIRM|nr:bifunctional (p)ppGpp synthetase/guanosine-3',5'-bis(diphosphate) 3'-pyrophosphohydrolase [Anaeromicropila herbilytica]BCN29924.1 GTP pyrophosphokinase [Anaeromicropila herbilytica]